MSTRIIKFKYGSDIRKISIGGDCDTYVKLKHLVEFIFRDRSFDTGLRYKYVDSDGDLITIRNDEDWRMALLYEKNLKIYVYRNKNEFNYTSSADTCKTDIDPCVAVKNAMLLSQHEAINVAEQLAVMRTLLLRIIERIAGEKGYDNGSLIDKGFKYGINKSTGSHFQSVDDIFHDQTLQTTKLAKHTSIDKSDKYSQSIPSTRVHSSDVDIKIIPPTRLEVPISLSTDVSTLLQEEALPGSPTVQAGVVKVKKTKDLSRQKSPKGHHQTATTARVGDNVIHHKTSSTVNVTYRPPERQGRTKSIPRVKEMLTAYNPLVWVDTPYRPAHRATPELYYPVTKPHQYEIHRQQAPRPQSAPQIHRAPEFSYVSRIGAMHPGGYVEEVLVESTFPGGAVAQLQRTFASDFIHYTRSVRLPPSTAFDIYRCRTVHPETTLYDTSVVSSVRQTFVFTDCEYNPALYPSFREGLYNICPSPIEIRNPMLPDIVSRRCRTMAISQETRLYHPVNTLACQPTLPQRLVGTRCPGISLCAREEIRPQSSMLTTYQEEYGGQQWREMETVPGNCDASVLFTSSPPAAYCQWYPYLSPSCVPGAIQSTITQSRAIQCVPSLIRPSSSFAPLTSCSKVSQTLCAGKPGDWIQHSFYSTLSGTRSPHVIHSSSLIRENRCPELLTNIPIRPVERFEFDTCLRNATDPSLHPPGVTVMRKYSAEWEAPPRPKASCVRCALNPAPQSDIVASLNAPNYACRIAFHSEEPSCSSISRVTSVRHGREMDTYVVSSAMVQNPPVMQTSDGTFLVSDTLKSESGRFVGPIPLDRTTVSCSQVDPILHPHRTRPQFQLLGSSLYPPPRGCFIRTVTATDVQRVIPKPPPPTTPNRKSWNRDSSWNYLREMRESRARSPFGLFPRAASPLGQASDCSFLVSERSEITRSGAPPHGSSASPVGFFGYDDTTTTVTTTYRADFQDPRLYQKRAEIQCYLGSKLLESTRSPSPFGHPTRYASHIGVERSHTASSMRLFPTIPVQTTTTGPRVDKPQQRRRNLEPKASPKSPKAPLKSSRRSPRNTGNTNQMTGKRETGKQHPDLLPCGHLKNLPQKLEEMYAMVERLANFRSCECTLQHSGPMQSSEQIQPDRVQTQPSKWDTNLAAKSTITPLIREASTQVGESPGPTQPPTPTQPEDNQAKCSTSDAIFVTPSPPTSRSRESSINDLRRERQGSKTFLKTATPPKDRTPSVIKPYGNLDKRGAWQHSNPSRRRRGSDEGLSEETGPEINDTSTIDGVYTDDEVETVDSLESTTSETSLYSAVITDPIPLGVTVEVRIAHTFTACDSEMDDLFVDTEVVCKHTLPIFNCKSWDECQCLRGATSGASHDSPPPITEIANHLVSPVQVTEAETTSQTRETKGYTEYGPTSGRPVPSGGVFRALKSKQITPLSGEQVQYEQPSGINVAAHGPRCCNVQADGVAANGGGAMCPLANRCGAHGTPTYIHVMTRAVCCSRKPCTSGKAHGHGTTSRRKHACPVCHSEYRNGVLQVKTNNKTEPTNQETINLRMVSSTANDKQEPTVIKSQAPQIANEGVSTKKIGFTNQDEAQKQGEPDEAEKVDPQAQLITQGQTEKAPRASTSSTVKRWNPPGQM